MFTPIIPRPHIRGTLITLRCGFLLLLTLLLLAERLAAQSVEDAQPLEPGRPVERDLAGGQSHSYSVTLNVGQYLHAVIDQRGIDVVVTLFAPDGRQVAEVDSPNGPQGPEPISIIAEAAGIFRLAVHSSNESPAGRYEVQIKELRLATEQDQSRVAAQQAYMQAESLRGQGTAESMHKAINKYEETLPIFRALGDRRGEAYTLVSTGVAYEALGERQKALDSYSQALPLFRALGDHSGEVVMLNNIGVVSDALGEKQKALDHLLQALPLFRALHDRGGEAWALNNIGIIYDLLGEKQKALDFYGQALPLFHALGDQRGEATALHNSGLIYDDLDEKQKALDYYAKALLLFHDAGDRAGEAYALNNTGSAYLALGEKQKALDYFGKALALRRAIKDRNGQAASLNNIGFFYLSSGEKQKARAHFTEALALFRSAGDRRGEAVTLFNLAYLERESANLTESLSNIEDALDILELLRTRIGSQELRASYFATVQKYYEFYVDVLMRLHKQRPTEGFDAAALQASEGARARSLLELLKESRADIRQGVNPALVEQERSLQQLLNDKASAQARLLNGPHTAEQATAAAKELEALTTEYREVEVKVRQASPRYAALTQPQPLSLEQIKRELDADTLLLEYSLGDQRSYLWAVSASGIESFDLPGRVEVEAAALQFYELLNAPHNIYPLAPRNRPDSPAALDPQQEEALETASRLSRMLLGPVASRLGRKRLVIVADGALQYLPFAALPDPASLVKDVRSMRPLIAEHEIVSLPSVAVLLTSRGESGRRELAPKVLAVLADPVFSPDDKRVTKYPTQKRTERQDKTSIEDQGDLTGKEGVRSLVRLEGTRREAKGIFALAPASKAMAAFDFSASRALSVSGELRKYRYVHFATHGRIEDQHPELSAIVLSLIDEKGNPQDGYLRLNEIFNLNLLADVVVVSGCETGLGKEVKGEGFIGLTRGFMYAGAPRVVTSLWRVDDEATAELMVRFYRGILKGKMRPAAALRAAQVGMSKQGRWQSPHYWAAFVLQGEWR